MATVESSTDKMVCYCYGLRESDVRNSIHQQGCDHLNAVMKCSGAGTGCTACHRRIQAVLNQHLGRTDQCPCPPSGSSPTCVTR